VKAKKRHLAHTSIGGRRKTGHTYGKLSGDKRPMDGGFFKFFKMRERGEKRGKERFIYN
jgi:hypothetical protein